MAKKAQTTFVAETLEPRIYEIGYLLSPAVRDEDLESQITAFKETLTKMGATFIAEGAPEFIDIAYQMECVVDNKRLKFNQGYFGWMKFELNPAEIANLKEYLDMHKLLIRYLLIKAVRENTILGKKSLGKILKGERSDDSEGLPGDVPELILDPAMETVTVEAEIPAEKLEEALDEEIKELVKEI